MSQRVEIGAPNGPRSEPSFDVGALLERVHAALLRAADRPGLCVLTFRAPDAPSERLLTAEAAGDALLWAPAHDIEVCGLGAAVTLSARGPERFASIRAQASEVWAELTLDESEPLAPPPRFFGGFAFQPGQAESPLWQDFGDARFVMPRLSYWRSSQGAWLRLIARGSELALPENRAHFVNQFARAVQALSTAPRSFGPMRQIARDERSKETWSALLNAIQGEIRAGRAQKIVAARRVGVTFDRSIEPALVHTRLRSDAPESTRFALRVGMATFLGATPERLIRKQGRELATEAVAGSISAEDAGSAKRLLESGKDRREHEFVVSEILRLLGPLTSELEPAAEPEVHQLRTVLHLRTQILGRLREPSHVLELVQRLHPTPAVGGVPTAEAIEFITAHEPDERGWYAGPFGWFDAAGDGRFVVALRSGLVCGARAELYGGAGIVQDSHADSEFAETRWKLAALLGALGASG